MYITVSIFFDSPKKTFPPQKMNFSTIQDTASGFFNTLQQMSGRLTRDRTFVRQNFAVSDICPIELGCIGHLSGSSSDVSDILSEPASNDRTFGFLYRTMSEIYAYRNTTACKGSWLKSIKIILLSFKCNQVHA